MDPFLLTRTHRTETGINDFKEPFEVTPMQTDMFFSKEELLQKAYIILLLSVSNVF